MFEGSPKPMLVIDDDRHFVDVNPAACLLIRLPREQIVGQTIDDLTPPDLREWMENEWAQIVSAPTRAGTFTLTLGDGARVPVKYSAKTNLRPGRHFFVVMISGREVPTSGEGRPRRAILTQREREVLQLIATGATGHQIGERLSISVTTVQTHVRNAMSKLDARTRAHAIALALQLGELE